VVKYRRKVIDDEISRRAKEIFEYIAEGYGITLEEWNHDEDHVQPVKGASHRNAALPLTDYASQIGCH